MAIITEMSVAGMHVKSSGHSRLVHAVERCAIIEPGTVSSGYAHKSGRSGSDDKDTHLIEERAADLIDRRWHHGRDRRDGSRIRGH
jgi:hypothetical protein